MGIAIFLRSKTIVQLCGLFSTSDNYIFCKTAAVMQNGDFTFTKIICKYTVETPTATLPCHVTAIYLLLDCYKWPISTRVEHRVEKMRILTSAMFYITVSSAGVGLCFPIRFCFSVEY